MLNKFSALVVAIFSFALLAPAHAEQVTADMTVDNHYQFFLSTDDSQLGDFIAISDDFGNANIIPPYDWQTPEHFQFNLGSSPVYYLHIVAIDDTRVIAGFLGSFSLSDGSYQFDNGTGHINTGLDHWRVWTDGFGGGNGGNGDNLEIITPFVSGAEVTISDALGDGSNGSQPWGPFPTIDENAQWIWTSHGKDLATTRYFSTTITAVTPEPVSSTLFLLGGGLMGLRFRRKKTQ